MEKQMIAQAAAIEWIIKSLRNSLMVYEKEKRMDGSAHREPQHSKESIRRRIRVAREELMNLSKML